MKINTLSRLKSVTTWGGSFITACGFTYALFLGKLDGISGSIAGSGILVNIIGNLIGIAQSKREKEAKKTAEARLVTAETRITELTPIPLQRRLRTLLDKISPKILHELSEDNNSFSMEIPSQLFNALQALATEDTSHKLISLTVQPMMGVDHRGPINGVDFSLNPNLAAHQE